MCIIMWNCLRGTALVFLSSNCYCIAFYFSWFLSLAFRAFHHFIVHLLFFIVHFLTSSPFQCFIEPLLTSSSTPFFQKTLLWLCVQCVSSLLLPLCAFPSIFPLSLSPQFILLLLLASWLWPCSSQPLSAWSGCVQQCCLNGVSVSYTSSVIERAHCTQKGSNPKH